MQSIHTCSSGYSGPRGGHFKNTCDDDDDDDDDDDTMHPNSKKFG